ncbi:PAS domain-containing protein [Belliella marina]|uniref:PAS domain-containing protein n=1 Tax=Belliella marina TaxID=1644146 RepID=A0ABW4VRC1_9BACT
MEKRKSPLWCWDVISLQSKLMSGELRKRHECRILKELSQRFGWDFDWDVLFRESYEAIVLTDINQRIIWVSDGFKEMTGYPRSFAIGKKPSFLQGEETLETTRVEIREKIKLGNTFTITIVNYKKDQTPYKCEVTIHPLMNENKETVAFAAFESEVI